MTPAQKASKERRIQSGINRIVACKEANYDIWEKILAKCGLRQLERDERVEEDKRTLEELDPDDVDVIKKLTFQAMKDGLEQANAQMVRASLVWQEQQAGKEALKGVSIEVVPATIPDDVGAKLLPILEDLARSAREYQVRGV